MAALFGSAPTKAPYPTQMYPASSFFGATALAQAANQTRAEVHVTPQDKRTLIIVIVLVVGLGYAAWHFNMK